MLSRELNLTNKDIAQYIEGYGSTFTFPYLKCVIALENPKHFVSFCQKRKKKCVVFRLVK